MAAPSLYIPLASGVIVPPSEAVIVRVNCRGVVDSSTISSEEQLKIIVVAISRTNLFILIDLWLTIQIYKLVNVCVKSILILLLQVLTQRNNLDQYSNQIFSLLNRQN